MRSIKKGVPLENLEIRVRAMQAGTFAASCPELGLFCQADTEEEAVNTIQTLIAFRLTCTVVDDLRHASTDSGLTAHQPGHSMLSDMKVFYTPHRTSVQ